MQYFHLQSSPHCPASSPQTPEGGSHPSSSPCWWQHLSVYSESRSCGLLLYMHPVGTCFTVAAFGKHQAFDKCHVESSMALLLPPTSNQVSLVKDIYSVYPWAGTCDLLSHTKKAHVWNYYLTLYEFCVLFFLSLFGCQKSRRVKFSIKIWTFEKAKQYKIVGSGMCSSGLFCDVPAQYGCHMAGGST